MNFLYFMCIFQNVLPFHWWTSLPQIILFSIINLNCLSLLAYCLISLQVRYPVLLTPTEKQMAREVCVAFRQAVSQNEAFHLKCHLFVSLLILYYVNQQKKVISNWAHFWGFPLPSLLENIGTSWTGYKWKCGSLICIQ